MIEIQVHPSDIRGNVRYFFLDRKRVVRFIIAGTILLVFVIGSMAAAPTVIRRVYRASSLKLVQRDRVVQQEVLRTQLDQIALLERQLDDSRLRVEKLMLAYGLQRPRIGIGGSAPSSSEEGRGVLAQIEEVASRERQLERTIGTIRQQIDLLTAFEGENRELIRHVPSILPVPADDFVLTSAFGPRINPFTRSSDFHRGLDLAAPSGTPVYATGDGVVTFAGRYPMSKSVAWWRFGNVVVINHADRFISIYAHCESVTVKAGQAIRIGQTIATVGSTGWSTNAHLHYEVRSDLAVLGTYEPLDPRIYVLNYRWSQEQKLLNQARLTKDAKDFEPLPSTFLGRKRRV